MTKRGIECRRTLRQAAAEVAFRFEAALRSRLSLFLLAGLLMPAVAQAQVVSGGTDPTTILNNIATFILGPFGEGLAVLGVIGIGFAFIMGRASLGLVGSIVGGLVLIFGASYLITQFVGAG